MQKYLTSFYVALLTLLVSACSLVPIYRPTIEQGNLINQEKVAQLKPGMTRDQVVYLLGSPVLTSNFNADRWDYVYTFKPSTGMFEQKRVTLYFIGNRLDHIGGISYPQPEGELQIPVPLVDEPHRAKDDVEVAAQLQEIPPLE